MQELTLWLVGSIGENADPPADIQPLELTLPAPLIIPNEVEHEATNGTESPEPQPPSPSEYPSPSPPGRVQPATLSHSRYIQSRDMGYIRADRFSLSSSVLFPLTVPPVPKPSDLLPIVNRQSWLPDYPSVNSVRAAQMRLTHKSSPLSASRPRTSLQTHPRAYPRACPREYPLSVPPVPYVHSFTSPFSIVPHTCAPGCWNPVPVSRPGPHGDNALPL